MYKMSPLGTVFISSWEVHSLSTPLIISLPVFLVLADFINGRLLCHQDLLLYEEQINKTTKRVAFNEKVGGDEQEGQLQTVRFPASETLSRVDVQYQANI